ncbi:MAG: transketolase family protein [Thermoanaerobacteraceae bacterium]|nr:transketolase family protein [Thermoanaerobacteraceae bacterium]
MDKIATRDAYGKTLLELGSQNKDIVVLDADLSKSTKTNEFAKAYPDRFFDMGISEQDMIGTAAGLATCGKIPFASSFAVFATGRAYDQVRDSICYPNLNVKIAATHAGLTVGEDGATHQALEDISLMRGLPNMTVIVPADATSATKLIKLAAEYKGPVYIRLGRPSVPVIYQDTQEFQIGKGIRLKEGRDISIIATGIMVSKAIEAADMLQKEGITAEVIDIHTIKPIDKELIIDTARRTGRVITCEEHNIYGGLGSAVCEVLSENYPARVKRIGVKDTFGESGTPDELLKKYGLTSEEIVKAAREML